MSWGVQFLTGNMRMFPWDFREVDFKVKGAMRKKCACGFHLFVTLRLAKKYFPIFFHISWNKFTYFIVIQIFKEKLFWSSKYQSNQTLSQCLKVTPSVAFEFFNFGIFTNFCPKKIDLSGNAVWQKSQLLKNSSKRTWTCKCWMRLF